MRALSLDLSSDVGAVAIATPDAVLASASLDLNGQPLRECTRLVSAVLELAEMQIADIDILSSVTGPGSWTGLRVSAVTVNTIATALRKPVVGVSVFDSLSNHMQSQHASTIAVVQVSSTQACVSELGLDPERRPPSEPHLVGLESLASLIAARRAIVSMRQSCLESLRSGLPPEALVDIRELPSLSVLAARAALDKYRAHPAEFNRPIVPFYAGSPVSDERQDKSAGRQG